MSNETATPLYHEVHWEIDYRVRLGVAWSKFMRGLQLKELLASTCASCTRTFVPPQSYCEFCFQPITDWRQLEPVGTLRTSTIVYQGFTGGPEAPYAVGAIEIDGTSSLLMHFIGGVDLSDPDTARKALRAGLRVKAVWAEDRKAAITDIRHFHPVTV
jgi:uncharacterized OB-fold protein